MVNLKGFYLGSDSDSKRVAVHAYVAATVSHNLHPSVTGGPLNGLSEGVISIKSVVFGEDRVCWIAIDPAEVQALR
jgi:hypothetical protein